MKKRRNGAKEKSRELYYESDTCLAIVGLSWGGNRRTRGTERQQRGNYKICHTGFRFNVTRLSKTDPSVNLVLQESARICDFRYNNEENGKENASDVLVPNFSSAQHIP